MIRTARCEGCGEPIFERPNGDSGTEWAHTNPFDRSDMTRCGIATEVGEHRATPIASTIG